MEAEELLIDKAKAGDEEAFNAIINKYKNYIFAIILSFVKDRGEAENISQEVFLQVYRSLNSYKADNFKAWLSRIAANKSIDYIRSKNSNFKEDLDLYEEDLKDRETPETILLKKERERALREGLESLDPIYKSSLEKFYFEGKTYEEISIEDGVSLKTVASRLYRGKKILKERWKLDESL